MGAFSNFTATSCNGHRPDSLTSELSKQNFEQLRENQEGSTKPSVAPKPGASIRETETEQATQRPSATASASSSFDELFQMHITENEEHMKPINTEFERLSGVPLHDVAVKFENAPNKNVALATYIFLRSSKEYPDLVKQSKTRTQLYAQLAQHFAKTPEVQAFIDQLLPEQKVTKVAQRPSATASASSSFDELFQMHLFTENEEHMKPE